jgi:hypothetical protein
MMDTEREENRRARGRWKFKIGFSQNMTNNVAFLQHAALEVF